MLEHGTYSNALGCEGHELRLSKRVLPYVGRTSVDVCEDYPVALRLIVTTFKIQAGDVVPVFHRQFDDSLFACGYKALLRNPLSM